MKKLVTVALFASLLVPTSAMALENEVPLDVWIDDCPAGTIVPHFYKELGQSCLYTAEWWNLQYGATVACDVIERKTRAHLSCRDDNIFNFFPTLLESGKYCNGWDQDGFPQHIAYLSLGENYYGATGIACFDGWYLCASMEAWAP
jgi:hypothetical protein